MNSTRHLRARGTRRQLRRVTLLALACLLAVAGSNFVKPGAAQVKTERQAPKQPTTKHRSPADLSKPTKQIKSALSPATTACPNTTPISPGQTINGALSGSDCQLTDGSFYDVYTFTGSAGQQVAVSMNSTAFDTFLFLLNPNETELARNDDVVNGNTNSRIPPSGTVTLPSAGTYSILANSFDPAQTGSYTVTLSVSGGGTVCPPNPTAITNGQTVNGTLSTDDCTLPADGSFYDAYSFTASAGQQVAITMNAAAFDAYLILLAPDGADIAEDDDGGGGTNARIPPGAGLFATVPQTGTYVVLANSAAANQTGSYSLNLSISATNCPATGISVGQTVNGSLATGDCRLPLDASFVDTYTFNGTAGQQVAVTMTSGRLRRLPVPAVADRLRVSLRRQQRGRHERAHPRCDRLLHVAVHGHLHDLCQLGRRRSDRQLFAHCHAGDRAPAFGAVQCGQLCVRREQSRRRLAADSRHLGHRHRDAHGRHDGHVHG